MISLWLLPSPQRSSSFSIIFLVGITWLQLQLMFLPLSITIYVYVNTWRMSNIWLLNIAYNWKLEKIFVNNVFTLVWAKHMGVETRFVAWIPGNQVPSSRENLKAEKNMMFIPSWIEIFFFNTAAMHVTFSMCFYWFFRVTKVMSQIWLVVHLKLI